MSPRMIYVAVIDPGGAFLRAGPGQDFEAVESLFPWDVLVVTDEEDTALGRLGKEGQWLAVRTHSGNRGWVAAWLVHRVYPARSGMEADVEPGDAPIVPVPARAPGPPLYLMTAAEAGLNLRRGPGVSYGLAGAVPRGHPLIVLGSHEQALERLDQPGMWIPVQIPEGVSGWAAAWLLTRWQAPKKPGYLKAPMGHALPGLHGPADPGKWPWDDVAYEIIQKGRIEAVKLLAAADIDGEVVNRLRGLGVKFIMARLFGKFTERRTVRSFVEEVLPAAERLYAAGVRHFEVHNEPNLHHADGPEGMWVMWRNGREFGDFLLECLGLLRPRLPEALFGWPGLSPGLDELGADGRPLRYSSTRFLDEGEFAARACDFICLHTYWQENEYMRSLNEIREYCERFPEKLIIVSEFSNSSPHVEKDEKGRQYAGFYSAARSLPVNLGALFCYVMSASWGYTPEAWRGSSIARRVAERTG